MKWSTSFIVDGVDRSVIVKENLHAGGALRVVGVTDAVVQRSETARVLIVGGRTKSQQRLNITRHTRVGRGRGSGPSMGRVVRVQCKKISNKSTIYMQKIRRL